MARNPASTVYIGNLDEKVSEKTLYEVMVQVGHLVNLHVPRDKETNRHKGYAFAEYETEEIAQYAVRLFSGVVFLHNKTVKFAISGQDKPYQKQTIPDPSKPRSPLRKEHTMGAKGTEMANVSSQSISSYSITMGSHSSSSACPEGSANC